MNKNVWQEGKNGKNDRAARKEQGSHKKRREVKDLLMCFLDYVRSCKESR